MRNLVIGIAAAGAVALAGPVAAAGDAAAGAKKITTCTACHGKNGKAIAPNYPNLCGQNEPYLIDALKQYKSGARTNPIMKPMAATLPDADVADVAAYFASQSCG